MKIMRQYLPVIFLIFASAFTLFAAKDDGSPRDTNITYVGRWDKSDPSIYHSYWGGAYFRVSFTGTALKIKLAAPVTIYVSIDGAEDVEYPAAAGTVNLTPEALEGGIHTLVVAARYADDEIQFKGLLLQPGAATVEQPKEDIIEFIGNSITSGQATAKGDLSSYAWLTGEQLGTDHTQISYPGITLVDGYRYDYHDAPYRGQQVQYFWMEQPNHDPNTYWAFENYTPTLIVINLGTNDRNNAVPAEKFQRVYIEFLTKLRDKVPDAELFAMRPFNGAYCDEIQKAVKQRIDVGDKKTHYINTKAWLSNPADFVDGTHPTDAGHVKVTQRLSPQLKPYLKTGF